MEKISIKEARKEYKEQNGKIINPDVDGFVVLENINKIYPNHVQAVYDFNLSIKPQEFIVLVGPSGCGKSTTLRMIAGLEEISSGYLYIDKVVANHLESKDRNIAMVFQSYALYPNMSVYDNIAFGLKIRKLPKEEIQKRVFQAAEMLDLGPYLDRKPKELSGGQMQRVALGRAIVRDAKVFLMDEPLSNLDAKLRVQTRSKIVKIHKSIHATTVYVTHDQTEAMTMADRIVVMNKGFVQQVGSPKDVYNNPKNLFVATFIGTPPMNIFKANLEKEEIVGENESFSIPASLAKRFVTFNAEKEKFMQEMLGLCNLTKENEIIAKLAHGGAKDEIIESLKILQNERPFYASAYKEALDILEDESLKEGMRNKKAIKALEETNYLLASVLKKIRSAAFSSSSKKSEPIVQTKKKGFFSFCKKKENKLSTGAINNPLSVENTEEEFKRLLSLYEGKKEGEAYFGIRPENIHLVEDNYPNTSKPMASEITFFELLGSEYLVHFTLFGTNMIMKLPNTKEVHVGDKINVVFDLPSLKIFDLESGENILWEEKELA